MQTCRAFFYAHQARLAPRRQYETSLCQLPTKAHTLTVDTPSAGSHEYPGYIITDTQATPWGFVHAACSITEPTAYNTHILTITIRSTQKPSFHPIVTTPGGRGVTNVRFTRQHPNATDGVYLTYEPEAAEAQTHIGRLDATGHVTSCFSSSSMMPQTARLGSNAVVAIYDHEGDPETLNLCLATGSLTTIPNINPYCISTDFVVTARTIALIHPRTADWRMVRQTPEKRLTGYKEHTTSGGFRCAVRENHPMCYSDNISYHNHVYGFGGVTANEIYLVDTRSERVTTLLAVPHGEAVIDMAIAPVSASHMQHQDGSIRPVVTLVCLVPNRLIVLHALQGDNNVYWIQKQHHTLLNLRNNVVRDSATILQGAGQWVAISQPNRITVAMLD